MKNIGGRAGNESVALVTPSSTMDAWQLLLAPVIKKDHLMAAIPDRPCRLVGVDLHKQTIKIAVVDAARKPVTRKRFSNLESAAIVALLKSLGPYELVVESAAEFS